MVKPIPDGYHTVTPYLIVDDVAKLIEFTQAAFGAEQSELMSGPDGKIRHAEAVMGDSKVMMGQAGGETKAMPGCLYLYVEDVDAVYAKALEAGAKSVNEPKNQFYGDRSAGVIDPLSNFWGIATHVEDVPPEEMQRRAQAESH